MIEITKNLSLQKIHIDFLKPKLEDRIDTIIIGGKITKNNNDIHLNDHIKSCLLCIKNNLEIILGANPDELKKIIKFFQFKYPCVAKKHEDKKNQPPIYTIVYNIFVDNGYDDYLSKVEVEKQKDKNKFKEEKEYHAYKLVENLGIKTCPYCNRSYISFVNEKKDEENQKTKKKTRPQLDHFYPKAIYPFLACSFYNLIPSCSACNHMKSDDDSYEDEKTGDLVHPYDVKNSDFTFSYTLNNLDILNIIDKKNIKLEDEKNITITLDRKYEKNNEYFQLETIYQNHKDIVIELILKEINYPKSYINELISNGFATEEEIYRFIFSNYLDVNDLHKRPLSKLTKDIVSELGILYKIELAVKEKIV
ncbi:MAG: hypothetical protein PHQ90_02565 [Sulfuricurvum sp.]|uniref:hypothetical protein n=1 Tax=Sulfuricurvum sp. TaxID=2025608 RepID=UPI0026332BF1|nr:hypothetical protein [Sulfuricurvum sp.]MDD2368156.1 hypothetical protein [Sulfuricurvum sp.]MDD5117045.1 hypothetical protein [Sulfuricurvum sp.]